MFQTLIRHLYPKLDKFSSVHVSQHGGGNFKVLIPSFFSFIYHIEKSVLILWYRKGPYFYNFIYIYDIQKVCRVAQSV